MLQSIREITTRLGKLKPPKSPPNNGLLRCFGTTVTLAKVSTLRYPDEETRRAAYTYQAEYHRTRYHNDPIFRAKCKAQQRTRYDRAKHDAHRRLYLTLNNWTRRFDWVRGDLPWKHYRPVLYDERVERYCHGCEWTKSGGVKLWWRKRDAAADEQVVGNLAAESEGGLVGSDEYLCLGCYVSSRTRFEALPDGYEDVETFKDVLARKRQLDEVAAGSLDASNR